MARKKKSSLGVTFWMALVVFLSLIYAANRIDFSSLFGDSGVSGFIAKLFGGDYRSSPAAEKKDRHQPLPEPPPAVVVPGRTPQGEEPPAPRPAPPEPEKKPAPREEPPQSRPAAEKPAEKNPPAAPPAPQPAPPQPAAQKTAPAEDTAKFRDAVLYFITLTADGKVLPAPVTRRIPAGPAPLSETVAALLAGPTAEEELSGLRSLIPPGTSLQSAAARDGTAFLSFSENLRFNSFGIEGFRGQVRQIVFTATEFPTVRNVQILIDGGRVDFLSPEGLYIGKPLGRESF